MYRFSRRILLFVAVSLFASWTVSVHAIPAEANAIEHVLHISADGMNAQLLSALIANDTVGDFANFARLVDEGAYTFNARTDYEYTNTIPNHTSMFTGRPVLQPAGTANTTHHGYTNNGNPGTSDTLHNAGNANVSYIDSAFGVAHDNGLSTALYASKSKFIIYEQSYNSANGAADSTGVDNGADKIDAYFNTSTGSPSNASNMHPTAIAQIGANNPNYAFIHYRDPDSAGHAYTWGSAQYNDAMRSIDDYLGDIFDLVDNDPEMAGKTAIIMTTDHGGSDYSHVISTLAAHYMIPMFVWGPEIPAGADLYALNPDRTDPGTGHPSYDSASKPIRSGETGNLAMELLGLPMIPNSYLDTPIDVFLPIVVGPELTEFSLSTGGVIDLTGPGNDYSGITYSAQTQTLFVVDNGSDDIHEYSQASTHLRQISNSLTNDTEGITWMYGNRFAIVDEASNIIYVIDLEPGETDISSSDVVYTIDTGILTAYGDGLEGLAFDPTSVGSGNEQFFAVHESSINGTSGAVVHPQALYSIGQDGTVAMVRDLTPVMSDAAGLAYGTVSDTLYVLSEIDNTVTHMTKTGVVLESRSISADFAQPEGIVFLPTQTTFFVVGESSELGIYELTPLVVSFSDVSTASASIALPLLVMTGLGLMTVALLLLRKQR